uniref:Choline-sulfatase n=1 Tax=uncultured Elusimicrobia bacterium TaxID=699876 RepID=A0A650ELI4_9BACT|nr:choline-sulfatase [uncultured Elusimicrobia bacterium]
MPGVLFTVFSIPGQLVLFMLGLFVLALPWRFVGPKALFGAAVFWGTFFTLFFALDIFVYTQYRFHISMAMLELFFGPAGREIFVFPASTYVMLGVGILALAGGVWGLARAARHINGGKKALITAGLVLFLFFMGYNGLHAWGKFMQVPSILAQVSYLPWANPMSANRRLRKMGFEPKNEPYSLPKAGTLSYPLNPLACANEQKPNILIILIDSWRADSFSKEVMPRAWKQAEKAFNFTDHIAGGNATEAGVFSLFYSLPHAYWGAFSSQRLPPVFISRLQADGYQFGIFASARLNSPEFNQNVFSSVPDLRLSSKGVTKVERDEDMQKDFTAFIKQMDKNKPFFGFLFYDAPHGQEYPKDGEIFTPTAPQMNYLMLTKNTDPTPYMNNYKNSVHFVDGLLGQTFDLLKKEGLDKNTIVILTGDHGQEINDTHNNFWGHNSNFAQWQTHVPLLVWWPGKNGQEMNYRTSHYDIVPTLMQNALACANPADDYSLGQDLFDDTPRPFVMISSYTKKAVREGDKISVLDNYGYLENYDENYQKTETGISPQALSAALKTFSKFYK